MAEIKSDRVNSEVICDYFVHIDSKDLQHEALCVEWDDLSESDKRELRSIESLINNIGTLLLEMRSRILH
ncbi:MAG: hypothetical protein GWN00_00605 [Aliifodinibius sp.]|nr:hypothetical protein [Fodinibius sp.]NIW96688.1 hypothetical protein [Phycisphaerae bacterium]NIY23365.1 hypothetical protein [Fodinibius sp.]